MSKISKRKGRMDRIERKERARDAAIGQAGKGFFKLIKCMHAAYMVIKVLFYLCAFEVLACVVGFIYDCKGYAEISIWWAASFLSAATLTMVAYRICQFRLRDIPLNNDAWSATPYKSLQNFIDGAHDVHIEVYCYTIIIVSALCVAASNHYF